MRTTVPPRATLERLRQPLPMIESSGAELLHWSPERQMISADSAMRLRRLRAALVQRPARPFYSKDNRRSSLPLQLDAGQKIYSPSLRLHPCCHRLDAELVS